MKISVGIDIGSDGGYAIFVDSKLQYGKIPCVKGEQDMKKLLDIILYCIPEKDIDVDTYPISVHVVIEDLHSIYGSSAKSNFGFGVSNGLVYALLQIAELPFTKITPRKWQKEMWEGIRPVEIPVKGEKNKDGSQKYKTDTKATSLLAAKRLFPKESFLATERSTVPHNAIIDAVLMAEYCKRHF